MRSLLRATLVSLAVVAALPSCGGDDPPAPTPPPAPSPTPVPPPPPPLQLTTQTVIAASAGLQAPIDMQPAPGGDTRLFIAERPGRIRIAGATGLLATPFLDIQARTSTDGERGLLSFAFHPQYPAQPFVYVHYTEAGTGDILVDRYQRLDADRLDPNSRIEVIRIEHRQFSNHNGGRVAFGPDGMLYLSTGDGGGGGDPLEAGQNTGALLGKLLRLDVNNTQTYTIPADNPSWGGAAGARRESWAIGLRNPWRFAFDGGDLYIADVGQGRLEEINAVSAATPGLNYGWDTMEGTLCFEPGTGCATAGLTLPVHEYDHGDGRCSITGGYVYRGAALPELQGRYLYSDFCRGFVRSLRFANGTAGEHVEWIAPGGGNVMSFGADAAGELYLLLADGRVQKLVRR